MNWPFRRKLEAERGKHGLSDAEIREEKWKKRKDHYLGELKGVLGPETYEQLVPHPTNIGQFRYWYDNDDQVRSAVNDLAAMAVGAGFYTECENEKAKAIVDEFCKAVGLDQHLLNVVKTKLIYGFCPVERWFTPQRTRKPVEQNDVSFKKIVDMKVKLLPPHTVFYKRNKQGRHLGFVQRYYAAGASAIKFKPTEIVWFTYNPIGGGPYGSSIVGPIIKLLKAKEQTHKDMPKIIHRYAQPLTVWMYNGSVQSLKDAVMARQPNEDIFLGQVREGELKFDTVQMDPRGRFENYIENIQECVLEGLHAPSLKWFRNATQASATKLMEIAERHVQSIQRDVKRTVERRYFQVLLARYGMSDVPTVNWGPKPTGVEDIDLRGLADLVGQGALTPRQAVKLLQKMGVPVEEEEGEPPATPNPLGAPERFFKRAALYVEESPVEKAVEVKK